MRFISINVVSTDLAHLYKTSFGCATLWCTLSHTKPKNNMGQIIWLYLTLTLHTVWVKFHLRWYLTAVKIPLNVILLTWNSMTFHKVTPNTQRFKYIEILYCCTDATNFKSVRTMSVYFLWDSGGRVQGGPWHSHKNYLCSHHVCPGSCSQVPAGLWWVMGES